MNKTICFRCGECHIPRTHVATDRGNLFLCRECSDDLCAALYFEAEGFEDLAKEKREANCAKQQLLLKWNERRMINAVTFYWCSTHNREATHEDENGRKCCDPKLAGIMMPCIVKNATPVLLEEYEEGWCNPCPDMSNILHFFDVTGKSLCRKWKRWAGTVEKNPTDEKYLCKKCLEARN